MSDLNPLFPQEPAGAAIRKEELAKLKNYLVNAISRQLETNPPAANMRREGITQLLQQIYNNLNISLPKSIKDQLFHDILDDLLGFGPIQPLLEDDEVSEIMVNGARRVYIERKGKLIKTNITFENDNQVLHLIDRIILPLGRRIDTDSPTVDARLPDGSRVNAVIPPVTIDGPCITIRKFQKGKLTIDQLIQMNSITANMAEFLRACVLTRLNIIISGGTGSGKTTLLNALSSYIPEDERIVTIEDAAELRLQQEHVVRMESKNANLDGTGQVTIRDLVRNALRMRPDRIVVGEVRGGEALDMLQAMNTGHDGSLTTLHANSPRDALSRLETMTLMAGIDLPIKVVREQVSSAIDLIVQIARLKDGTRKVIAITEVAGMEGETIVLTDIFKFEQTGIGVNQEILGELKPTGIRPLFSTRLETAGFKLGPEVYGASLSGMLRSRR
jgi:pilus assembly protein CpaF